MGLLGLNFIEGDVRTLGEVPITRWVDFAKQNRDMLRYIKCNAIGDYGPGTLKLTKGLAEILNLPLYMHIGEFQMQNPEHLLAPEAFRIAEAGDMITHLYHGNLGQVIDENGKVLPVVRDAERRGVIFDLGLRRVQFLLGRGREVVCPGSDPAHDQLRPSAVQCRPAGQVAGQRDERHAASRHDACRRSSSASPRNAAKAISLDRPRRQPEAWACRPTSPCSASNSGEYEISDCYTQVRKAEKQIVPLITFKNGKRFDADMTMGQDESNWFLQFAEDHVPAAAAQLSDRQRDFLDSLATDVVLDHLGGFLRGAARHREGA